MQTVLKCLHSLFRPSAAPYGYMPVFVHDSIVEGLHCEIARERARANEFRALATEAERYAIARVNIKLPRRSR